MFDYTFAHWSTFFIAAILLNLTPGPDIAYVLTHTIKSGLRSGFAALFGVWSGFFLHVVLAAIGLSAILATSAIAFLFIKWVGAIYLIWLGIQALRSRGSTIGFKTGHTRSAVRKIYIQGVLVAALNPKVAFFSSHSCRSSLFQERARQVLSFSCMVFLSWWSALLLSL